MKGSVIVLLGCLALFFAAPSHSYSVKFISEDEQVANRQATQSGDSSPDVATTGDAAGNSDTPAGESESIKTDGDTKPGNESVSGDAQTEKSNIRKRDTRSMVRDMTDNPEGVILKPVSRQVALYLLKKVGYHGDKCFKEILRFLEEHELMEDSYSPRDDEVRLTRSGMVRWLKMIQGSMSRCLRQMTEPLINGAEPTLDDYTRNSIIPPPESEPFLVGELLSWFGDIGKALEKCLKNMIRILEERLEDPVDTVRRSSETVSDLFAELMEILSQIDGESFAAGEQFQMNPPGHTVPPYPDSVPVIPTYKSNFLDKTRGYRHYSNLPGLVVEQPIPLRYTKEIPNYILPPLPVYKGQTAQLPDTTGITTLPEDVTAVPNLHYSLLDLVLDKIYSRLRGRVPPGGNLEPATAESLGGDANGVLGLYRGPINRQSLTMENPRIFDPDISQCVEECMNKGAM